MPMLWEIRWEIKGFRADGSPSSSPVSVPMVSAGFEKPALRVRSIQPIDARGCVVVEPCLFPCREILSHALEGIPQDAIGTTPFVDREIAFEHASLHAEALDCVQIIILRGLDEFRGGCGPRPLVESEAVDRHREAAELGVDIR